MKKNSRLGNNAIALVWGFAEATVFFIVPDVLLSYLAFRNPRTALRAALFVLAGALLGGTVFYMWTAAHPIAAMRLLNAIPGITPNLISQAYQYMLQNPLQAMLIGSVTGVPYKIFCFNAAAGLSLPLLLFLAYSIPARLLRFVMVIGITTLLSKTLMKTANERLKCRILAAFWVIFYIGYFTVMGW